MRATLVLTCMAVSLAACGGASSHGTDAGASCAAPTLAVAPARVHAGQAVDVSGAWYAADCYDTGANGHTPGKPPPMSGLAVTVTQGARSWTVRTGLAAHGDRNAVHARVTLPAALQPGAARVRVHDENGPVSERATLQVRR